MSDTEVDDGAWLDRPFTAEDNPHGGPVDTSNFTELFPKYREAYIKEVWPLIEKFLNDTHNINCELDLVENKMSVTTTRKTFDPWAIMNAKMLIKLLSRSVPFEQALKVFDDDKTCAIVKIDSLCRNKDRFRKRRERLVGPDGATLKALEVLTGCYVFVVGKTVASIGPHKGLKQVERFVEQTMKNTHPVYLIKTMMIKRELEKDPKMKNADWSRFLPDLRTDRSGRDKKEEESDKIREKKLQQESKKTVIKPKSTTPFPSESHFTESKVDKQLESGEYFLKEEIKTKRKLDDKKKENQETSDAKKAKRAEKDGKAPKEKKAVVTSEKSEDRVDVKKLKAKLKSKKAKK